MFVHGEGKILGGIDGCMQGPDTVPTGLRGEHAGPFFPTLKRGANNLCASGAFVRTLFVLSQRSS
jgi:hypothetical protein